MTIVISLGGSLVVPDRIDVKFLKKFRELIISYSKKEQVILVVGGGSICRKYQQAAAKIRPLEPEDLDWIGIHSTRLNAQMIKFCFKSAAHEKVIHNPHSNIKFKERVMVASGWKPGWSTDYDAVVLAEKHKAGMVINMTNVDYVYDKNPKEHKDASPIRKMRWKDFISIVGSKWDPGLNSPFDPVAAKKAEKAGIKVAIIGSDVKNLKSFLDRKKFKGTIIG